jgi:preprotein translocase subunit SecE
MSREITSSQSEADTSPLLGEMFHASIYKPLQGRIVRQLTVIGIWVIVAMACWSLYTTLRGSLETGSPFIFAVPGVLAALGLWFGFRVVNWPRFADFLIAVEAEMKKVTWPTKDEMIRASIVVIVTMFFLAISLFLFDLFWQAFFYFFGVTS